MSEFEMSTRISKYIIIFVFNLICLKSMNVIDKVIDK